MVHSTYEHNAAKQIFTQHLVLCEECVGMLMSEDAATTISNHEVLLEKMFAFQEQLMTTKELCENAKDPQQHSGGEKPLEVVEKQPEAPKPV